MNNSDYFVMYETETGNQNSFLVDDSESASKAWDEAVKYIEDNAQETAWIIKFEKV